MKFGFCSRCGRYVVDGTIRQSPKDGIAEVVCSKCLAVEQSLKEEQKDLVVEAGCLVGASS